MVDRPIYHLGITNALLTLFWILALCPTAALALDTKKPLAEFMHQTWSVDNGLPQSTVLGISQTTDGYVWFATHEGVARFDGLVFTVFDESNTPVLRGSGISALLARKDGSLSGRSAGRVDFRSDRGCHRCIVGRYHREWLGAHLQR